jgi:hypothetical protein
MNQGSVDAFLEIRKKEKNRKTRKTRKRRYLGEARKQQDYLK